MFEMNLLTAINIFIARVMYYLGVGALRVALALIPLFPALDKDLFIESWINSAEVRGFTLTPFYLRMMGEALTSPPLRWPRALLPALGLLLWMVFVIQGALPAEVRAAFGVVVGVSVLVMLTSGARLTSAEWFPVLLIACAPFILFALAHPVLWAMRGQLTRLNSANGLAALAYLLAFPLWLVWPNGWPRKIALAALMAVVVISASRGAWLGVGAVALVVGRGQWRKWWPAALMVVALSAMYLALLPRTGYDLRADMWRVAWQVFTGAPVWGAGPGAFVRAWVLAYPALPAYPHAHNIALHVLAEYGAVGALVVSGAVAWAARRVWLNRHSPLARGVLLSLLALGVHSLVDMPTYDWGVLTVVCILVGAALGDDSDRPLLGVARTNHGAG